MTLYWSFNLAGAVDESKSLTLTEWRPKAQFNWTTVPHRTNRKQTSYDSLIIRSSDKMLYIVQLNTMKTQDVSDTLYLHVISEVYNKSEN